MEVSKQGIVDLLVNLEMESAESDTIYEQFRDILENGFIGYKDYTSEKLGEILNGYDWASQYDIDPNGNFQLLEPKGELVDMISAYGIEITNK
jgi:bifunctional pyridoxal-dependent enzyme with beta-cystathionase and maltose regulon repressor activities